MAVQQLIGASWYSMQCAIVIGLLLTAVLTLAIHLFFPTTVMAHRQKATGFSLSARLKWFGIPVSVGVTCLALVRLKRVLKSDHNNNPASPQPFTWQLTAFSRLPSRMLSRSWGRLMEKEVPTWLRRPLYGMYVWKYSCNMAEAAESDLRKYNNFSQLFVRKLKSNSRPVDTANILVAPVDGKVLHCGQVKGSYVEQVKGVHYSLDAFLGPGELTSTGHTAAAISTGEKRAQDAAETQLYHIVLYLAPGDYHHFHSPTDWNAELCRHMPGELLTVAPWAARKMPGLFALNERVVLSGTWPHGLFTFTAVGAYNVGSIGLSLDPVKDLRTNIKGRYRFGSYSDTSLGEEGVVMSKGDHIGLFKLGSSVVLLFEAPKDFKFLVKPGQRIRYGQPMGQTT